MKKQLIIAVSVFTVGFAVGYGITWILVSGGQPDSDARAEVRNGLENKNDGNASAGAKTTAQNPPERPKAKPQPEATPTPKTPKAASAKSDSSDEAIGTAPVLKKTPQPSEAKGSETGSPTHPPESKGSQKDSAAATAARTWWDSCKGKVCAVNWGAVRGGISVRKGSISHGSRVDWKLRFGNASRLDTIKTTRKNLRVHSVGLGLDGKPTCAEVEYKRGAKSIRGILALKLGNKRIRFIPPSDQP